MAIFKKKEKENTKPKSKARKIVSWVLTSVFGVLFVGLLVFQIIGISSKKNNYNVPNFGGMQFTFVLTDSMESDNPNDNPIPKETLLFVQKVDASTLKVGDDITFYYSPWASSLSNPIITHRIREIKTDTDGSLTFTVGGINKHSKSSPDVGPEGGDCTKQSQTIKSNVILGKVVGKSQTLGGFYKFISSIWGLLILLIVPVLYLVITYTIDIVKALKEPEEVPVTIVDGTDNKESNTDKLANLSEEDKKRLKEEMIEEMMRNKK